ncbi:recombination regulator RecX [Candidatus Parcubacteria bacterium]|nr:recombination regulator RecX [Patescibacteria group bacterium]MBU4380597.1 recombination regulator RecX [Patescibacteria group bacterium]MCG2689525.1 recombination regulator RecX [Candidatus Parcubacteria bacterium]
MSSTESWIFDRCLGYLGIRQRSQKEISDYIKKLLRKKTYYDSSKLVYSKEEQQNIINLTIDKLVKLELINDHEFARLVVSSKTRGRHPKGTNAIKADLYKKGIDREIIKSVLLENIDDKENAKMLAQEKLAYYLKKNPQTAKQKTLRYLVSRGFFFDTAISAIDSIATTE